MSFFYSIIGILLFSSIILVNRFVLLLSNNNLNYSGNIIIDEESKQVDKFVLTLLNDGRNFNQGEELCLNLKKELTNSVFLDYSEKEYIFDGFTKSLHPYLINSCILTNGKHRILLKKKTNNPILYSLNSCLLKKDLICSFEKGDPES